ncbi:DNA ligase [Xylophilus rhododendri]|uniref:DNA ligase n=1 Tax=Xylophilus rhododendri TaxID=2697032 RepID=A0A857JBQ1_9BURK|nr:DNA ligase [Xylophilus rhododendri]QHJ01367.1 DNA ligase [Xylophilus rhododendri]
MRRRAWLALGLGLLAAWPAVAGNPPPLMLANVYRPGMGLADYWVSEKLDGNRGYWDGKKLWTRGGEEVFAPAWFIAGWPTVPMDGELWAGRGQFQKAVSITRQQAAGDEAWRGMRFMVFDLPAEPGIFTERLAVLNGLLSKLDSPWARPVAQSRVATHAALMEMLQTVVESGGEGLVLHRGSSVYAAGRSDDLVKVKPFEDADAKVVGYAPGRGKYAGLTGTLLVETREGQRLRIGSGLNDALRRQPPVIGHWISYRFRGHTDAGLPRFATFVRERPDLD